MSAKMPAFTASAPGKIILFGEHAVVYGQPAIAVPVMQVRARATVSPHLAGSPGEVQILAPDVGLDSLWDQLPPENPLGAAIQGVAQALGVKQIPACTLKVTSTIPVASGLGSGAAVSVAVIRALAGFLGHPLPDEQVSALAYEIEKIHHGTPSGIDNTVVTYARPVYFQRLLPSPAGRGAGGEGIVETFEVAEPFTIMIADTGIPAPTKESVGDVRRAWRADPQTYERLFAAAGSIAKTARQAIEGGHPEWLGPLMTENHELLQEMGVSCPELDCLVEAAKDAGALGAKLSGGGRGGNLIALVKAAQAEAVARSLEAAGAVRTITTLVGTSIKVYR
jgi:mevalonate kinase